MEKIENGVALRDDKGQVYAQLEHTTGRVYDLSGRYTGVKLEEHGPSGQDPYPDGGDVMLSRAVAEYTYKHIAKATGHKSVKMRDAWGEEVQVNMDLGIGDVHIPSLMPNFAGGYALEDGVADLVCPVVPSPKDSDYYAIWDSANVFKRTLPSSQGAGGSPPEVGFTLSTTKYKTIPYALAAFIPTEVEANADAPLRPYELHAMLVVDKLRLEREFRAATLLTTSGNWNSNNVITLGAGAQWNNGASSDPVANMHSIEEKSFQKITRWVFSEPAYHAFVRNPAVRAYWAYNQAQGANIPSPQEVQALLKIAPITIAGMKYSSSSAATYVWPSAAGATSAVVALHEPKQNPPTDQKSVATAYTFRWTNAPAPDGTVTAGMLVRSYFDPRRGPRGGRIVVCAHNDTEVMTANIVGGLILGVIQ